MSARAIAAALFLASAAGGCAPDLTRADGRLELRVGGIEPDVTEVAIEVALPDEGTPYRASPALSGSTLIHVVESVPAGAVSVTVTGRRGDAAERRWRSTVTVAADTVTEVSVRLDEADGGGDRVTSAPLSIPVGPLTGEDVVGGQLAEDAPLPSGPLAAFLEDARGTLGVTALTRVSLASARVAFAGGNEDGVDDAWRGALRLTAGSEGPTLAQGVVTDDAVSASLAPTSADATALWQRAATEPVSLRLEGDARRESDDEFEVRITLTLVLTAR